MTNNHGQSSCADSCRCSFTGKDHRKGWRTPQNKIKCNEQHDEETGYSYHGARYYDPDLSGLWLSVDPMADKYPGINPYAYCAWNPVKLVDPDGMEIDISAFFDKNGRLKENCKLAYDALSSFAKTRFGYRALALFAKEGQVIAGQKFTKDGFSHKDGIDLSFKVGKLDNGLGASGETGHEINSSEKSIRMKLTISLCNPIVGSDRSVIASYLETICHEMFFHAFSFADDYKDDGIINDSQVYSRLNSYSSRNDKQEHQDLVYEHRYRNYAIPIMTEYFGTQKTRKETITWMSQQGRNFKKRPNWYKK